MHPVLLLSLLLRAAAFTWSALLWRRRRDWRFAGLSVLLALMVVHEIFGHVFEADVATSHGPLLILSDLGVSLFAIAAVWGLGGSLRLQQHAMQALARERAMFEQLFESAPEAIVLLENDGRIRHTNGEFTRLFGYTAAEAAGRALDELVAPEGRLEEATDATATVAEGGRVAFESVRRRKDGSLVDVSVLGTPIHVDGGQVAVYGIYRDITGRKRGEAALRESERRYALAARGANDGLWDWDLVQNTVYFSERWRQMLGLPDHEVMSRPDDWFRRVHQDDRDRVQAELRAHVERVTPQFESEYRVQHADGDWRWVLCRGVAARDAAGRAVRLAGSQTDISARKRAEQQLLHDAFHDGLTGLPNRALFLSLLERSIGRHRRRAEYLFAVLFLDIDRFKNVNDSLGHMVGDQLLVAVARRIGQCIRPGDTVARLGGDEFTILLEDIPDADDAIRVAERIQADLAEAFQLGEHEVFTTASIGIALSGRAVRSPEEVLRDADTAMYRAKTDGKARHRVFDEAMHESAVSLLQIETDLRRALERNELRLVYQPIVRLDDDALAGFEALLRWDHPERGLITPDDFIRLAEETGLILPIGQWVLWEACRQMQAWNRGRNGAPPLTVSVNLSPRQFAQAELVEMVADALAVTGLPSHCLKLEITESSLMQEAEASIRLLNDLKQLGVQVQVDDFGTGYSSLSYLHRFQIDALKIDRTFVARLGGARGPDHELVRTIVTLARNLGIEVVAEGVEARSQRAYLADLGCDFAQGFLFGRPLAVEQAAARAGCAAHEPL